MAVRVKMNDANVRAFLRSEAVSRVMDRPAEVVEAEAKHTAPVLTGTYRDSIHVETEITDRVKKRVGSGVPYSRVVNGRTGNLARALDSIAGRRF